jgi:hypothetical protein
MHLRPIFALAALVGFPALAGCSGHSHVAPTPTTVASTAHFSEDGLAFDYPASWTPRSWPIRSTFRSPITYLSPLSLHDPCTGTETSEGESITCTEPVSALPPSGLLVSWSTVNMPHPQGTPLIADPNTTIGGRRARLTKELPAMAQGPCQRLRAGEGVTADIDSPSGGYYEMTACLAGPSLPNNERLVMDMLASVHVTA